MDVPAAAGGKLSFLILFLLFNGAFLISLTMKMKLALSLEKEA